MSAQQATTETGTLMPWDTTIGEVLDRITDGDPDKTFIEVGGASYSYGDVREGVRRTAAMFREMGVQHGDRVGLFMPNCVEYLYCWFGLSELGAISVPINTAYRRDETAYILNNAEAVAIVTDPSLADVAGAAAHLAPSIRHRILRGDEPTSSPSPSTGEGRGGGERAGWTSFSEAFSQRLAPLADRPEVSPDDVSMLVYTSGTTGNPKGVMVTHRMYAAAGQGFRALDAGHLTTTGSSPACPSTTPTSSTTRPWAPWPPGLRWSSSTVSAPRVSGHRCGRRRPPWSISSA